MVLNTEAEYELPSDNKNEEGMNFTKQEMNDWKDAEEVSGDDYNFTAEMNATTTIVKDPHGHSLHLPSGVIAVFILASMCAVLGVIYAYVYYTRINRSASPSSSSTAQKKHTVKAPKSGSELLRVPHVHDEDRNKDGPSLPPSTHVFLFKWKR